MVLGVPLTGSTSHAPCCAQARAGPRGGLAHRHPAPGQRVNPGGTGHEQVPRVSKQEEQAGVWRSRGFHGASWVGLDPKEDSQLNRDEQESHFG